MKKNKTKKEIFYKQAKKGDKKPTRSQPTRVILAVKSP